MNARRIFLAAWIAWGVSFAIATAAEPPEAVVTAEKARIAAIAKAMKPTIAVFERNGKGGGSGVVISPDGYALTNFHVTQPCGDYMKCGMSDGRIYDTVIVGIDPTGDVALVKLLGRDDFPVAEMADSDQVRVGDWCFAIGNPFLLATDLQPTVSYGIVSGTHRYQYPAGTLLEYADCLQTDAAINPGNSGGPLFNAQGQLIGVNGRCSFEKRGRVNVGVGYAISINQIKHFLGYLHSGRLVDHATLGATVATDTDGRVLVSNLLESSDAYRRGLRYGDEIVSFGGRPIGTTNAFKNVLGIFPKGWRIPLEYRRQGERKQIFVRLTGVHTDEELLALMQRKPAKKTDGPKKKGKGQPPTPEEPKTPHPEPGEPEAPAKIPDAAAKLIKAKTGYTNYYFNELNRDRVWSALKAKSDFMDAKGEWLVKGKMSDGGPVELRLAEKQAGGKFPGGPALVEFGKDLGEQLDPPGSGGMLVALAMWRRMLTLGPEKFGEVYYLGTMPLAGTDKMCDVLIATHDVVECRFMFDPGSGQLVAIEMYPDTNVDPCEIRFDDFREVGHRQVPHRWQIRYGDKIFGELEVQEFVAPKTPDKKA